jgi:hypothetical protein
MLKAAFEQVAGRIMWLPGPGSDAAELNYAVCVDVKGCICTRISLARYRVASPVVEVDPRVLGQRRLWRKE